MVLALHTLPARTHRIYGHVRSFCKVHVLNLGTSIFFTLQNIVSNSYSCSTFPFSFGGFRPSDLMHQMTSSSTKSFFFLGMVWSFIIGICQASMHAPCHIEENTRFRLSLKILNQQNVSLCCNDKYILLCGQQDHNLRTENVIYCKMF